MARRLVSVDDLMAPAVAEALDALELRPEDVGIARLARRYGAQIDEAARIAADLAEVEVDDDNARVVYALRKRVEAYAVLAELGPKLVAALESLGASPRARHALKGGVTGGKDGRPSALASIRGARGA